MNAFTKVVSWSAGLIGGLVGNAGSMGVDLPAIRRGDSERDYQAALVGRNRRQIVKAMGAPPTASLGLRTSCTAVRGPVTFWHATTWYYPVDPTRHRAIAIKFEGNRAQAVDLIG